MDRREALKISTLFVGYTLTAGSVAALMGGCKADTSVGWQPSFLSSTEADLLAEVCETILPKTDTPGAKDALCHRYIDEMIINFMNEDQKQHFKSSLIVFDELAKAKFTKAFVALNGDEKEKVMEMVVEKGKSYKDEDGKKPYIFNTIKDATVTGYFSSEVGATGGLRAFIPVPGPYQGCIHYSTVGKSYAL